LNKKPSVEHYSASLHTSQSQKSKKQVNFQSLAYNNQGLLNNSSASEKNQHPSSKTIQSSKLTIDPSGSASGQMYSNLVKVGQFEDAHQQRQPRIISL